MRTISPPTQKYLNTCRSLQNVVDTHTNIYNKSTADFKNNQVSMCAHRQVSEGLWKTPEDFSNSSDVDFTKSCDLDILTSPSLTSLPDFTGTLTSTTGLSVSLTTNSANIGIIFHLYNWLGHRFSSLVLENHTKM